MEKILANKDDIAAIEEALQIIYKPDLNFIFKDKSKIDKVVVVTLDSDCVYYWKNINNNFKLHKTKINSELPDISHHWWACGPFAKGLQKLLPNDILDPEGSSIFISGGLLTPLLKEQQEKKPNNPYTFKEGYLATIVHEFGHAYFNQFKSSNYLKRKNNLELIKYTRDLYANNKLTDIPKLDFITSPIWSEVFAFCTDYSVSKIFWKKHFDRICRENFETLNKIREEEINRDVYWEFSPIDRPHIAALVMGPILCENYSTDWPNILLSNLHS
jgi:hypothetical protein